MSESSYAICDGVTLFLTHFFCSVNSCGTCDFPTQRLRLMEIKLSHLTAIIKVDLLNAFKMLIEMKILRRDWTLKV